MVRASFRTRRTLDESVAGPGAHVQLLHRRAEEVAPGVVDGTVLPLPGVFRPLPRLHWRASHRGTSLILHYNIVDNFTQVL
jgi:hypothetical protein